MPKKLFPLRDHDENENKKIAFTNEKGSYILDRRKLFRNVDYFFQMQPFEFREDKIVFLSCAEVLGGEVWKFGADIWKEFDEKFEFFVGFDGFVEVLKILHFIAQ